jgi:HNH endonuclease/AP2 domain
MNQQNLTQAQVLEMFSYADGKLLWRKKTSRKTVVGNEAGTVRKKDGYRQVMIDYRTYRTHRLVYLYHYGWMPEIIDHINQNPTDNRIENLRSATRTENAYNCKLRPDNTSGVKGVTWCKNKRKWVARLYADRRCVNLGRFADMQDAIAAVMAARTQYHGAFASEGMPQ